MLANRTHDFRVEIQQDRQRDDVRIDEYGTDEGPRALILAHEVEGARC